MAGNLNSGFHYGILNNDGLYYYCFSYSTTMVCTIIIFILNNHGLYYHYFYHTTYHLSSKMVPFYHMAYALARSNPSSSVDSHFRGVELVHCAE